MCYINSNRLEIKDSLPVTEEIKAELIKKIEEINQDPEKLKENIELITASAVLQQKRSLK